MRLSALALCGVLSFGNACSSNEDEPLEDLSCPEGVASVTSETIFNEIAQPRCMTCHYVGADFATGGGLRLDTVEQVEAAFSKVSHYEDLPIVAAGHPERSVLFLKVVGGSPKYKGPNGESVGGQMPQSGSRLPADDIAKLKAWICTSTPSL